MIIPLLLIVAAWQTRSHGDQAGLLGADEVMRRLARQLLATNISDPIAKLHLQSDELKAKLDRLTPEQAARGWLKLMLEWEQVTKKSTSSGQDSSGHWLEIMMNALPEPQTWPIIRNRLSNLLSTPSRRAAIAVMDDLLGRDQDVLKYLESKRDPDADPLKEDVFSKDHKISEAEQPVALRAGNLDLLAKIVTRRMVGGTYQPWGELPDLVKIFGRNGTRVILHKVLDSTQNPIGDFKEVETQDLARSIVLSDLAKLKCPQWSLVRGWDDFDFVAAQIGRFGEDLLKNGDGSHNIDLIYALGLAKKGQVDHAEKLLASASGRYVDLDTFVNSVQEEQALFDLVTQLLDRRPIESLWLLYEQLGRSLGRMEEVVHRLNHWLSTDGLIPIESRVTYLAWKADLDLAQGRIKSAIAEYEECIRAKGTGLTEKLLEVAKVVGDREALDFVARTAKTMGTAGSRLTLFDAYVAQDRISDAQLACLSAAQDVHNVNLSAEGHGRLLDAYPSTGIELAELYYRENQPDQIVTLLHEYPSWGAVDLVPLVDLRYRPYYQTRDKAEPLGFYAAWAFSKTGQFDLAIKALHTLLATDRQSDAAFDLLNQLQGISAIGFYDSVLAASPLEAKTLTWKGDLLLRAKNLREAVNCVRTAIALDPTGEGAGLRHFAYDLLARILEANGIMDDAQVCRQIVKAARITEIGNKLQSAGLASLAAEQYRQALSIYPTNALAQRYLEESLTQMGMPKEADATYRKLLELTPVSGGLVEGLDLFEGRRLHRKSELASMTRETLEALTKAHPQEPGILFAFGQFESRVGNDKQALTCYETVVKMEPRFLRAWQEIASLAPKGVASKRQIKEAVLAVVRLEQMTWLNSLPSSALNVFDDKSELWLAFRKLARAQTPLPKSPLFPLEASKRSLASGTRPFQPLYTSEIYKGPGAALGSLVELQSLYP